MPTTLVKRNTTTNIAGEIENDLNTGTDTTATITLNRSNAGTVTRIWGTVAINLVDWDGGDYT